MTPPNEAHEGINAAMASTLRAERAAAQMTVDKLAAKSGIPKRTLLRLLNAERHINTDHLSALADALGIPPTALLQDALRRKGLAEGAVPEATAPAPISGMQVGDVAAEGDGDVTIVNVTGDQADIDIDQAVSALEKS